MTITINGTSGITSPELTLDNAAADGGQVVLKSSGYSNWNLDNYSGRFRGYYGSTEYFTVDTSGNVGIGTSSMTGSGNLYIGGAFSSIYYNNATGSFNVGTTTATNLTFGTNNTVRATIDTSGNLLVGTTSSTVGSGFVVNYASGNGTYLDIGHPSGAGNGYGYIRFFWNGGIIGQISQNGTTAVTYATSSDYRLKENVQQMTGALATVAQLKPVTYKWKSDGSAGQGFIAHELQEVVPECVTGEKDAVDENGNPVYQGIDTSFLVATLTAAIQEQQAIIESLKTRIETLENK